MRGSLVLYCARDILIHPDTPLYALSVTTACLGTPSACSIAPTLCKKGAGPLTTTRGEGRVARHALSISSLTRPVVNVRGATALYACRSSASTGGGGRCG